MDNPPFYPPHVEALFRTAFQPDYPQNQLESQPPLGSSSELAAPPDPPVDPDLLPDHVIVLSPTPSAMSLGLFSPEPSVRPEIQAAVETHLPDIEMEDPALDMAANGTTEETRITAQNVRGSF